MFGELSVLLAKASRWLSRHGHPSGLINLGVDCPNCENKHRNKFASWMPLPLQIDTSQHRATPVTSRQAVGLGMTHAYTAR